MTVEVDNQSSYRVECLVLSLWQAWELTDVPDTFYQTFKVQQQVLPEVQLEGVPAHSAAQGKQARWAKWQGRRGVCPAWSALRSARFCSSSCLFMFAWTLCSTCWSATLSGCPPLIAHSKANNFA